MSISEKFFLALSYMSQKGIREYCRYTYFSQVIISRKLNRFSYQDALPSARDTEDADCLYTLLSNIAQPRADSLLVKIVAYCPLSVWSRVGVLRLRDANDQHYFIVSSDEITIELLGLRINRAATMIKLLRRFPMVRLTLAVESLIIW
jgi:hypothetical protein